MLNQCIMSLTQGREVHKEFLIVIVLSLSDIGFLDELYQAIHEVRINLIRVNEERLNEFVSLLRLQRQLFVLVVIKDYLENALLLQRFVLVLLVCGLKCIDWAVELFLGESLWVDG